MSLPTRVHQQCTPIYMHTDNRHTQTQTHTDTHTHGQTYRHRCKRFFVGEGREGVGFTRATAFATLPLPHGVSSWGQQCIPWHMTIQNFGMLRQTCIHTRTNTRRNKCRHILGFGGRGGCTIADLPGGNGVCEHTSCKHDPEKHMEPKSEHMFLGHLIRSSSR